ncbi:MAG TPA: hypothetical protein VFR99_06135 [Marmoricola sp.]|nr:hypothetical protein [Marmoricola sp.]
MSSQPRPHQLPLIPAARPRSRAEASAEGFTRSDLDSPRWRSSLRNVHSPVDQDPTHPHLRLLEAAGALVPGTALGGWAAGWLHGARELDGRGHGGQELEPVLVCLDPPAQIRWRRGLRPFRSRLLPTDLDVVDGVTVTSVVRTGFDLARLAPSLADAVADLDCLCRDCELDPAAVAAYASQRRRWRGVEQAVRAAGLVDVRTRSRGESRLRVLWRCDAKLPRPEVNARVVDPSGHLLGIVDLLDVESGLAGEYDGSDHRELAQHTADNGREEGLERAGLTVVRFTSLDLSHRLRTVQRLREAWLAARRTPRGGWAWRPRSA